MEYTFLVLLLVIVFVFIKTVIDKLNKLENRMKNIKVTLDQIANVVEVPEHPINNELRKLLKEGKEIQAIKEVRAILGLSLLEAKQYVDALKM
ncbi:ribosomal protein L7/L12 [Gottfriedia acidiceleris]|uniref:ribosomal protein L7/L12 n=1 Tax=Gottfriedia acidiceleris TaxID=371036 RepID=UPI000B436631|nr:ribosomal protein L7/L12 [Gottfriedia acidiceleris]